MVSDVTDALGGMWEGGECIPPPPPGEKKSAQVSVTKRDLEGEDFFVSKPKWDLEGGVVASATINPSPNAHARRTMVNAPWNLFDPSGRAHYVADAAALLDLAKKHALVLGNKQENLLRRLVDPGNTKVRTSLVRFATMQPSTRVAAGTHTHIHTHTTQGVDVS